MSQTSPSFSEKFNDTAPIGAERVISESGLRGKFEDLWKQGKIDTGDLWNQRKFWAGRDPLLGKADKPGLQTEGDDQGDAGEAGTAADREPSGEFTRDNNPLDLAVRTMNPGPRAVIEQGLNDMLTEPMDSGRFNFDDFANDPQRYQQEFLSKISPENRGLFEQRLEEFAGRRNEPQDDETPDSPENESSLAFLAVAIGSGQAGRLREYLRQTESNSAIAGGESDDNDSAGIDDKANRIARYQLALDAINNEIANIDHRLFEIEQLQAQYKQWSDLFERRGQLEAEINDLEINLGTKEAELEQTRGRIRELETQQNDATLDGARIVQERTALQTSLDEIATQRTATEARREEIMAGLRAQGLDYRNGSVYEIGEDGLFRPVSADREAYLKEQFSGALALGEKSKSLRQQEQGLVEQIQGLDSDLAEVNARRQEIDEQLRAARADATRLEGEVSAIRTELQGKRQEYNTINEQIRNDPELQKFIANNGLDPNDNEAMKAALARAGDSLEPEKRALLERRSLLYDQAAALANDETQAMDALGSSLSQQESLYNQQNELNTETQRLLQQSEQLRTEYQQLQEQKLALRAEAEAMQPEINRIAQSVADARGQVVQAQEAEAEASVADEAAKALVTRAGDETCSITPSETADLSRSARTEDGQYIVSFQRENGEIVYGTLSESNQFSALDQTQTAALQAQLQANPTLTVYDQFDYIKASTATQPSTMTIADEEVPMETSSLEVFFASQEIAEEASANLNQMVILRDAAEQRLHSLETELQIKTAEQTLIQEKVSSIEARQAGIIADLRQTNPAYSGLSDEEILAREQELGNSGAYESYNAANTELDGLRNDLSDVTSSIQNVNTSIAEIEQRIETLTRQQNSLLESYKTASQAEQQATEQVANAEERGLTNWRGEIVYEDDRFMGLGLSYKDAETGEVKQHNILASVAGQAAHAWQDFWKDDAQTGNQIDEVAENAATATETRQQTEQILEQTTAELEAAKRQQAQLAAQERANPNVLANQPENTSRYSAVATRSELENAPESGKLTSMFDRAVQGVIDIFRPDPPAPAPAPTNEQNAQVSLNSGP